MESQHLESLFFIYTDYSISKSFQSDICCYPFPIWIFNSENIIENEVIKCVTIDKIIYNEFAHE